MGKIAILCGDDTIGWSFVHGMANKHPALLGFVARSGCLPKLTQQLIVKNQIVTFEYDSEEHVMSHILAHGVTTVVLAGWSHILHELHMHDLNVINIHPGYLPYNRGTRSWYWAICENTPFGATIHRVDDGVDTGPILWRQQIDLDPTDTGESAHRKGREAAVVLLTRHLDDIAYENFPPARVQEGMNSTAHNVAQYNECEWLEPGLYDGHALVDELRARTFDNAHSGRRIEIDGVNYRIHLRLVKEDSDDLL